MLTNMHFLSSKLYVNAGQYVRYLLVFWAKLDCKQLNIQKKSESMLGICLNFETNQKITPMSFSLEKKSQFKLTLLIQPWEYYCLGLKIFKASNISRVQFGRHKVSNVLILKNTINSKRGAAKVTFLTHLTWQFSVYCKLFMHIYWA